MKKIFKAGKYYIGNPCYLFDKSWSDILDNTNFFEDEEQVINGETVLCSGTKYGDGYYKDNFSRNYPVDAGLIGILPVSLIDLDKKITIEKIKSRNFGQIIEFKEDFLVDLHDGLFTFGDIIIDTSGFEDEDDESCDCGCCGGTCTCNDDCGDNCSCGGDIPDDGYPV